MLMDDLIPLFRDYYKNKIVPKDFDYIVPMEIMGLLLLKEIHAEPILSKTEILCKRAFDFISKDYLERKSAGLIDDMVLRGHTLNTAQETLKEKGLANVEKFAFMLFEDENTKKSRKIDGTNIYTVLSPSEYEIVNGEIEEFLASSRPTNPDHIRIRIRLSEYRPTDFLKQICEDAGLTVEYKRNREVRTWSIHDPIFAPILPNSAIDKGVLKIRVFAPYGEKYFEFVPNFFPVLEITKDGNGQNDLWRQFYDVLDREWQNDRTRIRNKYESSTLALRTDLAKRFMDFLDKNKCPIEDISLSEMNLDMYYGKEIAKQTKQIMADKLKDSTIAEDATQEKTKFNFPDRIHIIGVYEDLMKLMNKEYEKHNEGKKERYDWEHVGLNIKTLADLSNYSIDLVSIGAEILNDYGYCDPMFSTKEKNGKVFASRDYRLTERGSFRLNL